MHSGPYIENTQRYWIAEIWVEMVDLERFLYFEPTIILGAVVAIIGYDTKRD